MFTPDLLVALWPLIAMGMLHLYDRMKEARLARAPGRRSR